MTAAHIVSEHCLSHLPAALAQPPEVAAAYCCPGLYMCSGTGIICFGAVKQDSERNATIVNGGLDHWEPWADSIS